MDNPILSAEPSDSRVNPVLVGSVVCVLGWMLASGYQSTLLVMLCLGFFIMFHEFGHFVAAKMCGMKVTEFFVGFGPRVVSFRKGETEYGIKVIPLGGYVKIVGMSSSEEVDLTDEARTYRQQSWLKKVVTIAAGPFTHFVAAFILLFTVLAFTGVPLPSNYVTVVKAGSSADRAGLVPGDKIVSVDGVPTFSSDEIMAGLVVERGNVVVTVESATGRSRHVTVTDRMAGVTFGSPDGRRTLPVGTSFVKSGVVIKDLVRITVGGLAQFFRVETFTSFVGQIRNASEASGPVTDKEKETRPVSVVGMTQLGAGYAEAGVSELLLFLVIINLALGVFNLLPVLPLDGGHIVVATIESVVQKVTGRRYAVNMKRVGPVVAVFTAFIVLFSLGAVYLDVVRPLG